MRNYLSLTLALILPATGAQAIELCAAAKNGVIKEGAHIHLRSSCKSGELTLPISFENGGALVRITGANVQIVDGTGDTGGDPNGLGNLIVGYNEESPGNPNVRTGSHNVVVGPEHSYSANGGVVGGYGNRITNDGTAAFGNYSQASGLFSVVAGGFENEASGDRSVVAGGQLNTAGATGSATLGGRGNRALGFGATVSGGDNNAAGGGFSTVSGGRENRAAAPGSVVSGGFERTAPEENNWVAGSLLQGN